MTSYGLRKVVHAQAGWQPSLHNKNGHQQRVEQKRNKLLRRTRVASPVAYGVALVPDRMHV